MTETITQYYERRLQDLALQMVEELAAKKQAYAEFQRLNTVESYDAYTCAESRFENAQYEFNQIVQKYAALIDSVTSV